MRHRHGKCPNGVSSCDGNGDQRKFGERDVTINSFRAAHHTYSQLSISDDLLNICLQRQSKTVISTIRIVLRLSTSTVTNLS